MIQNLNGSPANIIRSNEYYSVPTIKGVPIVLPSHVDEGNNGPTTRHYHVDFRFAPVGLKRGQIDPAWLARSNMTVFEGDIVYPATILDDGTPWEYRMHLAQKHGVMSGEVFESTLWLYLNLGDVASKDGKCVHHATELSYDEASDDLVCPAHGMRYKLDGSPRYKAPFWVCHEEEREPLSDRMEFRSQAALTNDSARMQGYLPLRLEDSDGIWIAQGSLFVTPMAGAAVAILRAWPKSSVGALKVSENPPEFEEYMAAVAGA